MSASSKRSMQLALRHVIGTRQPSHNLPFLAAGEDDTSTRQPSTSQQSPLPSPASLPRIPLSALPTLPGRPSRTNLFSPFQPVSSATTITSARHFSWGSSYLMSLRYALEDPQRQVSNLLIALNLATYLMAKVDGRVVSRMLGVSRLIAHGEWHRLLTSGFLHVDLLHVALNMLSIHWLGPSLESATGRGRFLAIYLTSIMSGSFAAYYYSPASVFLGASGGVYGAFAALLVYRLRNRNFLSWDAADQSNLIQVVGINVLLTFLGGSFWPHLGGAIGGAAMCFLIGPRYRWRHGNVVDEPLLGALLGRRQR